MEAFNKAKSMLASTELLAHFVPGKDVIISCDASPYGVGTVLAHKMIDGTEQPIMYASRPLATPQKIYSLLDEEGLAIMFMVNKFHQYIYGRKFMISSDHQPLLHIFGDSKPEPTQLSVGLQRCALTLGGYNYQKPFHPGKELGHADGPTCLQLPEVPAKVPLPVEAIPLMENLKCHLLMPRRSSIGLTKTQYSLESDSTYYKGGLHHPLKTSIHTADRRMN